MLTRCHELYANLFCARDYAEVRGRLITYKTPIGDPPPGGWPAVVFFQGSFTPGENAFLGPFDAAYGGYDLTLTVKALLDSGFVVIAPNAQQDGAANWQTNIEPYADSWTGCEDDLFVTELIGTMAAGAYGAIDMSNLHAMGISSGGYMTSRMAVSYAGTFRSLAIVSASYATCGPTCTVPDLPADHPATLFLHGDIDPVVPIETMYAYRDRLLTDGRTVETIVATNGGHEWPPEGKTAIPAWFAAH